MTEEQASQPLEPWIPNALDIAKVYSAEEIEKLIRTIERLRKDADKLAILNSIRETSKKVREKLQQTLGIDFSPPERGEQEVCKAIVHESLDSFAKEEIIKKLKAVDPDKRLRILAEISAKIYELRKSIKAIIKKDTDPTEPIERSSTEADTLRIAFNAARKLLRLKQKGIAGQVGFSDSIVSAVWRGKRIGKKALHKMKEWLDKQKSQIGEELKKGKHELNEEETQALKTFFGIE